MSWYRNLATVAVVSVCLYHRAIGNNSCDELSNFNMKHSERSLPSLSLSKAAMEHVILIKEEKNIIPNRTHSINKLTIYFSSSIS